MTRYNSKLENPIYAIYTIENLWTKDEKHIIFKICKTEQTAKKYLYNHPDNKQYGYVGYSQEVYPTVKNILTVGTDVNSLKFRLDLESCHI